MSQFKVTPYNIRNGNKAPYFIVDASNKHESETEANKEFKNRSALSKYPDWRLEIEKI